ncbi:MAG: hypothetical protein ACKVTZ_07375 [Bacteroidia bacterium]
MKLRKWIHLAFIGIGLILNVQAQQNTSKQQQSIFGSVHTPKGNLHCLVIFVRFTNKSAFPNNWIWPDTTAVGEQYLPAMVKGEEMNALFNQSPETIGQEGQLHNISELFALSSGGKFRITADVFPEQVPVTCLAETDFAGRQVKMNEAAIQWIAKKYPNFDWSKYDNRKNMPNYLFDNSETKPDSIIDYLIFLHRDAGFTGMGSVGSFAIPNTPYRVVNGYTGMKCFTDPLHNLEYFKHEFAHNLYNAPHYGGANYANGNHLNTQRGWGLMSSLHANFNLANAWERWWLGWAEPQTITKDGIYTLKDLATTQDAIRIQVPHTENYVWIENHQRKVTFDNRIYYLDEELYDLPEKGVYLYVVNEHGANRNKPQLSPFNLAHVNLIKFYNGDGFHDYTMRGDTAKAAGTWPVPVWVKGEDNPISGVSPFQNVRYDNNKDGKITMNFCHGNLDCKGGEENEIVALDKTGGAPENRLVCMGDEDDAFNEGDEIGLSGIVPILNYPSYVQKEQRLEPYYLNGISIKILEKLANGDYRLQIKLDDYQIRENKRWCGNLRINPAPLNQKRAWEIMPKAVLWLNLGGSFDRVNKHPKTNSFVNPTYLSVEANNQIVVHRKAKLVIEQFSGLELMSNAQIIVEKGGVLEIKTEGELILNENTSLIVKKGGKVVVDADGHLREKVGAKTIFEKGARVKK